VKDSISGMYVQGVCGQHIRQMHGYTWPVSLFYIIIALAFNGECIFKWLAFSVHGRDCSSES
jgi:hypothetical protein